MARKKKSLGKLKQDLQQVFNAYIRKRDYGKRCISCGQRKPLEAGHYYAAGGYDGLRFEVDNVHGECIRCNRFDHSHLIGYGINLEKRIGKKRIEVLHRKAKDYKMNGNKWTRFEINEMIRDYKEKIKEFD